MATERDFAVATERSRCGNREISLWPQREATERYLGGDREIPLWPHRDLSVATETCLPSRPVLVSRGVVFTGGPVMLKKFGIVNFGLVNFGIVNFRVNPCDCDLRNCELQGQSV